MSDEVVLVLQAVNCILIWAMVIDGWRNRR